MRRAQSAQKHRSVYLDVEAIAAWMRISGVPVKALQENGEYVFTITQGETVVHPMVPLKPYNPGYASISTQDMHSAIEMTKATTEDCPIILSGRKTTFIEAIKVFMDVVQHRSSIDSLYAIVNRISASTGAKLMVTSQDESKGPKGTPIVIVALSLAGTPVGHVVCTGQRYSLSCSEQRILEAVLKEAPADQARTIVQRYFRL